MGSPRRQRPRVRPLVRGASCVLTAAALLAPSIARADGDESRRAAAAAFDDAVGRFDRAEYAEAARKFLEADALSPSDDALANAMAAGKKANEHLLVVEAAERAIARAPHDSELATAARDSLATAARSLSRLDLSCDPAPCTLALDGAPSIPGPRYVLPGTHVVSARTADGASEDESLSLIAGAAYAVRLHATATGEAARPANVATSAPSSPSPERTEPRPAEEDQKPARVRKPLSPGVFYGAVAASAVVTGAWIWSGIDTLHAASKLPNPAPASAEDSVRGKETRSNVLFAAAVVLTGVTVTSAFVWVDWGDGERATKAGVAPVPGGAVALAEGRF